ncbi:type II secretion system protein GspL [Variovorax sp. HJSM1_2]|uniref:type II secretion system protein GspL n=1 Tax=Variovorax sp. HJSM1_2 TaxID=3366263 RepID=UPI003BD98DF1
MSTLIVLLPPLAAEAFSPATAFDYVWTEDDRAPAQHDRAPASVLPSRGKNAAAATAVVAVVPVQALSWHRLELPRGSLPRSALSGSSGTPRLRAVLEGLLEDRLLEEPETLHFAVQPGAVDGAPVWVAVCQRAWLRAALATLESAKCQVLRIVPEFAPAADDTPQPLQALGTPEHAQLVHTSAHGVRLLPLSATTLALTAAEAAPPPLVAEPLVAALTEQLSGHPAVLRTNAQRWVDAAHSPWDLAQFEFNASGSNRLMKRGTQWLQQGLRAPQWRAARWGIGLLVAAQVIGLNAWAWKESASLEAQRNAVRSTLVQTFPHVKVVVDAPVQMERELVLLRQATGASTGHDLEGMLSALGTASVSVESFALTGVEFNGSTGVFRGTGLEPAREQLAGLLATMGFQAKTEGDQLTLQPAVPKRAQP